MPLRRLKYNGVTRKSISSVILDGDLKALHKAAATFVRESSVNVVKPDANSSTRKYTLCQYAHNTRATNATRVDGLEFEFELGLDSVGVTHSTNTARSD